MASSQHKQAPSIPGFKQGMLVLEGVSSTIFLGVVWRQWRQRRLRMQHIRTAALPPAIFREVALAHPQLTAKDMALATEGLRQFFLVCLKCGSQPVTMPSRLVDALWHALILHTRVYEDFCQKAFGRMLHHMPANTLSGEKQSNEGLRRVWSWACHEEGINPRKPARLPLLFSLDARFQIVNGYHYAADCRALKPDRATGVTTFCGADFSSSAFDGGTDGFFDADGGGDSGDSSDGGGGGD